jgi:hypothetical protein
MTTTPAPTATSTASPVPPLSHADGGGPSTGSPAVDRFLAAVSGAAISEADVWADGATLDATVPNWRFTTTGPDDIRATYATWFADPGHFAELRRLPTPTGEVVEYVLCWEQGGVPHAAHHAHLLTLDADGRIAEDRAFCGGRWDASRLAEMQAADDA